MLTRYASFVKPIEITQDQEARNRAIEAHAITDAAFDLYAARVYHGEDREWYRYCYRRIKPIPRQKKVK